MAWRIAKSLDVLRKQINAAFPNRDKSSDGSIGDPAHAKRKSDHNPNKAGVVCAIDIDEDLNSKTTLQQVVDAICASRDPRVNYIIYEGKITVAGSELQRWKKYTGVNAHKQHAHISVHQEPRLYDSTAPWKIDAVTTSAAVPLQHTDTAQGNSDPQAAAFLDQPDRQPPTEQPTQVLHVDNVENANLEAPAPPPSTTPVMVKSETPSVWAKIGAGIAAITGLGIQFGNIITTKLSEMTPTQLGYVIAGLAIIGIGLWLYDRASRRAHEKTIAMMDTAADPSKNTVELQGK